MNYFIPTYEQALEMVNTRGELIFYESKFIIDDYNISLFCYRLATYNDFINPIIGKDYDARELRGISYVFDKDGTYKTFIMLRKFWNINQVPETQLSLLSNKKIKYINNKEDGSLISFIKLPNNRIVSKTKMGFFNEQTTEVDDIVSKNINISNFLQECFDKDYITLWEYVSFKNKIVLNYNTSDIVLLRVRDKDGEFIDIEKFRTRGCGVVDS